MISHTVLKGPTPREIRQKNKTKHKTKESRKFLQAGIGVSTQYDNAILANVETHQLALRSEILNTMSEFSEENI